jgi:hypothetical protein
LELIRAVACLSPEARTALLAFLSAVPDAGRIAAESSEGKLVLSIT